MIVSLFRRSVGIIQPHLETATGNIVHFEKGVPAALKSCVINITAVQSGSGTPSPSNVRPISGWTGANVVVSPTTTAADGTTYPVSWQTEAGTVYGGTVDAVTGVLKTTMFGFDGTELTNIRLDSYDSEKVVGRIPTTNNGFPAIDSDANLIASRFSTSIESGTVGRMARNGNDIYCIMPREDFSGTPTASAIHTWFEVHPTTFVYNISSESTYQLDPQTIRALRGVNNIWSNSGDTSIQYWTH